VANTVGAPSITPPWVALSMLAWSADANTSAGAPLVSCWTSVDEPWKLYLIVTPGCAASNCGLMALKDSVSDAGANTVSVFCSVLVGLELELAPDPQPVISSASPASAATIFFNALLLESRRRPSSPSPPPPRAHRAAAPARAPLRHSSATPRAAVR